MNPIAAKAQKRLGLDRLSVSGGRGDGDTGPSVEAGRYVSERVNVGVRQSTSGTTQARVQIDLTRRLKIETTVGSGGGTLQGTTPENSPETSHRPAVSARVLMPPPPLLRDYCAGAKSR